MVLYSPLAACFPSGANTLQCQDVLSIGANHPNGGQTGNALSITDEQIWRRVVDTSPERKLNAQEIERLSQAFRALATMDKKFPNVIHPA
jgi:hypothetical protein